MKFEIYSIYKMRLITICFAVFSVVFSSCNKTGTHVSPGGIKYIVHHTDNKPRAVKGDVLQLKFSYTTKTDSLLFSSDAVSDSMILQYADMKYGQMTEALGLMGEGDSITFIFSPDSVFQKVFDSRTPSFFRKDDMIYWNVKLVKLFTRDQFKKTIEQRIRNTAFEEDREIKSYCLANDIDIPALPSGLVYIPFKEGAGETARKGDSLVVKYTGRFLSGQIFDSSDEGKGTVRFVLGKEKMIAGWEEGFLYMKEEGVARFVIPSRLAYGMKGYGPVPGDTPLIYDVEVVKIINNKPS
jgi:FKBP-type peptidyl-prolyl cis-trans isomerase FkpA